MMRVESPVVVSVLVVVVLAVFGIYRFKVSDNTEPMSESVVRRVRLINSEGKTLREWTARGNIWKNERVKYPLWEFTTVEGQEIEVTPTVGATLITE